RREASSDSHPGDGFGSGGSKSHLVDPGEVSETLRQARQSARAAVPKAGKRRACEPRVRTTYARCSPVDCRVSIEAEQIQRVFTRRSNHEASPAPAGGGIDPDAGDCL